jgi:hypothetical protein
MARQRKFDRERQKEVMDEKALDVEENFMSKMQEFGRKRDFLSTIIRLKQMGTEKESEVKSAVSFTSSIVSPKKLGSRRHHTTKLNLSPTSVSSPTPMPVFYPQ